jgi:hypothetical protein
MQGFVDGSASDGQTWRDMNDVTDIHPGFVELEDGNMMKFRMQCQDHLLLEPGQTLASDNADAETSVVIEESESGNKRESRPRCEPEL